MSCKSVCKRIILILLAAIFVFFAESFYSIPFLKNQKTASASFLGATVEQQINVLGSTGATSATTGAVSMIDTTQYTGTISYYFEVVADVGSGTGTVTLTYNAGSAAIPSGGSTISISVTATSMARVRSAAFSPTGAQDAYITTISGTGISVNAARIIVTQVSTTPITVAQTQVEVGNFTTTTSTSFVPLTGGAFYWQWNTSKYTNVTHVYVDVSAIGGGTNTLTAGLYTAGSSCTTQLTSSQVTTATNAQQRIRSSDVLSSLTNSTNYMLCIKSLTSGSGGASLEGAQIVIDQASPAGITTMELQNLIIPANATNNTTTYTSQNFFNNYDPTQYVGGTFAYEYGATLSTSAGTGFTQLYNNTAASAVASSPVSTTSTTATLVVSSSLTMPSVASDIDAQIKNSATNTTTIGASWIEIDITSLPQSTTTTSKTSLGLGNSNPSTATTETVGFTPADTSDSVATIEIGYITAAGSNTIPTGLSMSATPTVTVSSNGTSLPNTAVFISANDTVLITITTPVALSATGSAVVITITTVINPYASTFYAQIATLGGTNTLLDSALAESQSITNITTNVEVQPNLTFTVAGLATGGGAGGACGTTTTGSDLNCTVTSTATAISFGSLSTSTTNSATQKITTTTNANFGYTVTLQENQTLTDNASNTYTIANVAASTTWTLNTTQGFGVSLSNGSNGDTYTTNFSNNTKYQPVPVNATTLVLASKSTETNTAGDIEFVNFQIGVSASGAAGNYTNVLDYVTLPIF